MNKQELINELKRISLEKQHKALTHPESKNYYEGMVMAYSQVVHMVNTVLKLDEPKKPVVPKCFDIDYKKYKYMENNKPEILLTAMGGIYRVSFSGSFRDLSPNVWKTGIKWNKWTKETILWASRNYADFCQAVISGDYEVEKEPLWAIKNADGNYLTKCALWGTDGVNHSFECNPSYQLLFTDKATADAAALLVNGTVEEVAI
ncbi:DUF1642 domain-containing protein [Enterococcus faecium]|uniref:DUF1642 domain-containing protein n=1 Tax=Enterococcus faecium TaxID=1352 RepID=UPI001F22FF4A|nr:DUF1642 domain-containing protein [Enterococcus faecium]